jgi:squalene cyclase
MTVLPLLLALSLKGGASHPLVTGESLYALSVMGLKGDEVEARRAWGYLISTQGQDGSWKNLSRRRWATAPRTRSTR